MTREFFKKLGFACSIIILLAVSDKYLLNGRPHDLVLSTLGRAVGAFNENIFQLPLFSRTFSNISNVVRENESLRIQNLELIGKLAGSEVLKRENESLKKQLDISKRTSQNIISARIRIITQNIVSTAVIDAGLSAGIKKGMAVVAGGNLFIGTTSEVFDDNSVVIMADDPRSSVSVRIGSAIGNARGAESGHGKITIDYITNKESINSGDLVTTSGLDGLPEGLPVAVVESAELKGGDLFKKVRASLIFEPSLGPSVFIISD